ncbi:MAG: hypothetical protein LBM09_00380 [Candidatus Nomurabacteria bacterium]|jgi:hypothetical protein|nr:hypothetical protein [Candidatus Nomurabacteria bacterium]
MDIKKLSREAIKSRMFVGCWILIFIQTIFLIVLVATNIRSTSVQIPIQYSAFNPMHYARDQWFYLFNFIFFAVAILVVNLLISLKILEIKGRPLALGFLWMTAAVIFISTIVIAALLRVAGIE